MNKVFRAEAYQIGFSALFLFVLGAVLFKLSIADLFIQSDVVQLLFTHIFPTLFELILLFVFFKIGYYIIITLGVLGFGKRFFGENKVAKSKKIIHVIWWIIFAMVALFIIVDDPAAILTSAGLVGLGLTVALQKPIMNFVGWVTIVFKDVYEEGDRIQIGNVRGDVKAIDIMNTTLHGLLEASDQRNQKLITIPNEHVLTGEVENYTKNSNYILDELLISITYESDYRAAMKLLDGIIRDTISQNIQSYIKKKKAQQIKLNRVISKLVVKKKEQSEIEKEKTDISEEIKQLKSLSDEFKPKLRLEMADSSIVLVAQFLTPYNSVKLTRTKINRSFLDAIASDKSIAVAYPHMQLVVDDSTKKRVKKKVVKK